MAPDWIAHRGCWWPYASSRNSSQAIRAAFEAGFGVEVDVRAAPSGRLVVAHDPPSDDAGFPWEEFLTLAYAASPSQQLFVDVKEPETVPRIARDLLSYGLRARAWLFDFELCGADPAAAKAAAPEVRCLARLSDHPEHPGERPGRRLPGWALGWWLDQVATDWADRTAIADARRQGPVFVVSPELHGRPLDLDRFREWAGADGVCTDFPHFFQMLAAGDERLYPTDPWWGP